MGVDGLCTDYPERVHEANKKFRPQATQTDAATFPFAQGPDTSGVDLRGLAAGSTTTASGAFLSKAEGGSTDDTALGGWYSRCDTCENSAEDSNQQRLIAALYGDLAGVRDFAVGAVIDAKVLVTVCARAVAVAAFLKGDTMEGKQATMELQVATALYKEAESEAEQTLRPFVSSAETFQWSVSLISTEEVSEPAHSSGSGCQGHRGQ